MVSEQEFAKLLQASAELAELFPDGLVYIGGIAIYVHAINQKQTQALAETTHDADLYISLADMVDLREVEELTSNRRLGKSQLIKRGFEFDIYTERHSSLRVPYDEVAAHSHVYDAFRVACLEHLLVLKLAAYEDRKGSVKGEKDAREILRIAAVADAMGAPIRPELVLPYFSGDEMEWLRAIAKGPAPAALAKGNAHEAKVYRQGLQEVIVGLEKADRAPAASRSPKP